MWERTSAQDTHTRTHTMRAYAALTEAPEGLRALASQGQCTVHENGVHGVEGYVLAALVVARRTERAALRRAFAALRWNTWVWVRRMM